MGKRKPIEIIKDYGDWNVPTSWDDITLSQFVDIMRMQDGLEEGQEPSIIDIIAALSGRTKNEVYSLPNEFVETLMAHLLFLNEPLNDIPSGEVRINGERYYINNSQTLRFGEYVDANSVLQSDPYNYSGLLAILCRKEGEKYDDDFVADNLDNRIEMWNNQPITKVYPLVCFFLTLYLSTENYSKAFLTELEQTALQSLQSIEDSVTHGDGRKRSILWRMKTRRKLRKLRRLIQPQY